MGRREDACLGTRGQVGAWMRVWDAGTVEDARTRVWDAGTGGREDTRLGTRGRVDA